MPKDVSYVDKILDTEVKFFFDASVPAFNKTHLDDMMQMGVTDVYIADDLLYNIQETKDICNKAGIGMRLVCNRIPATTLDRGLDYKSPLFAPQNRPLLDKYFDCYEFDCGQPYDWAKFDVLYRAWFEREGWNGDLAEINDDLRVSYPLLAIPQSHMEYKLSCKRRCARPHNVCDRCRQYVYTGMTLVDMGAYIKSNKKHLKMGKE